MGLFKRIFLITSVSLVQSHTQALNLESPFPSTVKGLSIHNAHVISQNGPAPLLVRGMEVRAQKQAEELKKIGIQRILIFKSPDGKAILNEIGWLKGAGFQDSDIHQIPFPWRQMPSFREACEMGLEALRILHEAEEKKQPLFLHCTVGEDRTGLLSALYRIRFQSWDKLAAFKKEMCPHGYGDGNSHKPPEVLKLIAQNLTPYFAKMALLLEKNTSLDKEFCKADPALDVQYTKFLSQLEKGCAA
jgi:hypothetical protein